MSEDMRKKKMQKALEKFNELEKEYEKGLNLKKLLDGQLNENKAVKEELDILKKDAEIYKLIGPVLIKQDLEEAKQNVAKRMEYITKEIKRTDDHSTSIASQQKALQEKLLKLEKEKGN